MLEDDKVQEHLTALNKKNEEYDDESEDMEGEEKEAPPTKPVFDEAEVTTKFDEDFPEIEIPPEVQIQKDNDWALNEEDEQAMLETYW